MGGGRSSDTTDPLGSDRVGRTPQSRNAPRFLMTQSGVEVVQAPELSNNAGPLWLAVEAFDLTSFEFEDVAARGVHLPTRGRQLSKGKLQRAIVGALQGQLHHDDIA